MAAAEIENKTAVGMSLTSDIKGKIIEYMWNLKKQGLAEATILSYGQILKQLTKEGADLYNPESIKETIAKLTCSNARKSNMVKAYTLWLNIHGLTWNPPKYKPIEKLPFIPLEKELDDLIAGCSKQLATFLQLLKETGVRRGEALKLKWTDIDFATNTIRITPEKGSNPRIFKISETLRAMLESLPRKQLKVFNYKNAFYLAKTFIKQRRRIAHKLGNPRLLQIHFHTFRHWKATMIAIQTNGNVLNVMTFLGHKNIQNTMKYIHLAEIISGRSGEYICSIAKTLDDAKKLIEKGFEYVCEMDGAKLFRKRK